jgi:hypothetical protein
MEWIRVIINLYIWLDELSFKPLFFYRKLDYWGTEYANEIRGTDGTFYAPFRTREQTVQAFSADLCKYVKPKLNYLASE